MMLAVLTVGVIVTVWYSRSPEVAGSMHPEPVPFEAGTIPTVTRPVDPKPAVSRPARPPAAGKLSPEPYRHTIRELEGVLYRTSPPSYDDLQQTSRLAMRLEREVRARENSRRAVPLTLRLVAWTAALEAQSDVGYAPPDLRRSRAEWERLRAESFQTADWFKTASSEVVQGQEPLPLEINRRTILALKKIASDIHHLISVGRPESKEIGEIVGDVRTAQSHRVETRWRRWRDDWLKRVEKVGESFPPHPGMSANPNVVMAYQAMDRALHHLRIVTVAVNQVGVPFLHQREANFRAAETGLQQAESYLARIGF